MIERPLPETSEGGYRTFSCPEIGLHKPIKSPDQNFSRKKNGSKKRTKKISRIKMVRKTGPKIFQKINWIGKPIRKKSRKKS
jgi:hypothetical protein